MERTEELARRAAEVIADRFQRRLHLAGGLIALVRVFLHCLHNGFAEACGNIKLTRRNWILFEAKEYCVDCVFSLKRQPACGGAI